MSGCYIKGRGWVKLVNRFQKIICCRNASDIHKDFLFANESEYDTMVDTFKQELKNQKHEFMEISADALIDKRVVPCKKYRKLGKIFILKPLTKSYYSQYCNWCNMFIKNRESHANGICIHCMKEFYDKIEVHYDAMDDNIKDAWIRAKMLDEI